jgi:formylglycine-generating enzyme required for sulfatase activity
MIWRSDFKVNVSSQERRVFWKGRRAMDKAPRQSGMFVSALVVVVLLMSCGLPVKDDSRGTNTIMEPIKEETDKDPPPKAKDDAPMVKVPAGKFLMGSKSGDSDEKPQREVYLDGFWIDKYEVTVDLYARCVKAGKCRKPETGRYYNWDVSGRGNHPINGVDWNQANAYCKWAGKKLPTEAMWEKAARGTDGRKFPWGNQEASCKYAVMDDGGNGCGDSRTWEVGSKPAGASPYGAHDMAGNVWEWTSDWYGSSYYGNAPARNPRGPSSGSFRVVRGGCWYYGGPAYLRAANRSRYSPGFANFCIGLRCARSFN